jgi:hypothetical protein
MTFQNMFEPALAGAVLPPTNIPLRLAARQMRWLRRAFLDYTKAMEKELGCRFEIDTTKLGAAFVRWLRAMERERRSAEVDRRTFMDFSASLMLQELMTTRPIQCVVTPRKSVPDSAAAFWPEGYTYTYFCFTVLGAVLDQEFGVPPVLSSRLADISFWHSYRENCLDDYRTASGFFQMALGYVPDWDAPGQFASFDLCQKRIKFAGVQSRKFDTGQ